MIGGMIVDNDGYAIEYEPAKNRITILLPPTEKTIVNTIVGPRLREIDLSSEKLAALLWTMRIMCEEKWPITDWCKLCKYGDIEGADSHCCNCEWSDDATPTGFVPKEELEK